MYKGLRILAVVPAYDEEKKIGRVVERIPREVVDDILVVDDGSTDRTAEVARRGGARVISLGSVEGVGRAILTGYRQAMEQGFDVAVTLAGNDKDEPLEIPRLLDPIADDGCDFVIGSRFLAGGGWGGDMPAYRKVATWLHPRLVGLFAGKRITESTNGFRAVRTALLTDPRIRLGQPWLAGYAMEIYLLMKVLELGYAHAEVPCTKKYPPKHLGITKMRPVVDWWNMLAPVFLIGLGLRR